MQVPFVGFQPIRTSEHMAAAGTPPLPPHPLPLPTTLTHSLTRALYVYVGVFLLLNMFALLRYLQASLTGSQFKTLFYAAVVLSAGAVFVGVVTLTYMGYIAPWSGRFYSLYDTG